MEKNLEKFLSKKTFKIGAFLALFVAFLAVFLMFFYLKIIPYTISNQNFITATENILSETFSAEIKIKKPFLKTSLSSNITFGVESLDITKDKKSILNIKKFNTTISFLKIFENTIILKNLTTEEFFLDINNLCNILPKTSKASKQKPLRVEWFDSSLKLNNLNIVYFPKNDTQVTILGKNLEIIKSKNPKCVHFNLFFDIKQPQNNIKVHFFDKNNVYIKNHKLYIDNFAINIDKSVVFVNAVSDPKNNFNLNLLSHKFDIKTLSNIVSTNLIIPQGKELLSFIKNEKGSFDFNIKIKNNDINGMIFVKNLSFDVVLMNNLPLKISKGNIKLTKNTAFLQDFEGKYGKSSQNIINMQGKIDDYAKSFNSSLEIHTNTTNDLLKNYVSPMLGTEIGLVSPCKTKILIKTIYDKIDIILMGKIAKGNSLLTEGNNLSPKDYDRAFLADLHFEKNLLTINSINYYIAQSITKESKIEPILKLKGKIDIAKGGYINNFGFEILKPLPSEFLNLFMGPKFFKKGTIAGNLYFINDQNNPQLSGNLSLEKTRIPSQRIFIKQGILKCNKDGIFINANGKFRKASYDVKGNIQNRLLCPIIVKNIDLAIDNLDIQRIMRAFNNPQPNSNQVAVVVPDNDDMDDDDYAFNPDFLIIEKCNLNIIKGIYKQIEFGNMQAQMTLDKNGILDLHSNKFDFAKGISSAKANCDLKNHKYSIKLGAKDVDSDIIATSLLDLKREITGKASTVIELNSDSSLKLNGSMKFIVKDGTIEKIGLVEYVLKFASFFRNPMAMLSPGMIVDLVNIPEGNFNKIVGHLDIKDNIVQTIKIKSYSPTLSSYIAGKFNLETRDASLRIYTKFSNSNKGFTGFLRNISLNNIANKIQISNNDANYYSVEINEIPPLDTGEKTAQIFLTKVEGDVEHNNFLSYLKRIK